MDELTISVDPSEVEPWWMRIDEYERLQAAFATGNFNEVYKVVCDIRKAGFATGIGWVPTEKMP